MNKIINKQLINYRKDFIYRDIPLLKINVTEFILNHLTNIIEVNTYE